jgi:glycosyltransferase involved in cell wall biosynthesis
MQRDGHPARSALVVVIPGDPETRTGGYGYDRRIIVGLRNRGWQVDVRLLHGSFPHPTRAARDHAARELAAIPDDSVVLVDGLALGALPAEAEREAKRLRIVALVHHPLAAETGLAADVACELELSERRALAASRVVVVTSRATAGALARYGVTSDRIAVVEPGTDPAPLSRGSASRRSAINREPSPIGNEQSAVGHEPSNIGHEPSAVGDQPSAISHQPSEMALLCVATLTPRKGHALLFRALASIADRRWRLTCAGSLDRDPATVDRLREQLRTDGLDDRVTFAGDLETPALTVEYDRADLFVLATLYEGYGMAVAEALARGLPVVSTATGAIADLVGGGGVVVPPGDLSQLTEALARVIGDARLREQLAAGARAVRNRLPGWEDAAAAMATVLENVAGRPR